MNDTKAAAPALPTEAMQVGRQLANVAFDLAQMPGHALTSDDCALLDRLRKQWEYALSASTQAPQSLDSIYAAWRAVGADVAGLDWTKFAAHLGAASPAVERDALRIEIERVLSLHRGTSGRIILERHDEDRLRAALANKAPGEPTA